MKFLFFTLIFFCAGCSKIKNTGLASPTLGEKKPLLSLGTTGHAQEIDIMVAFLWPSKIETQEQRALVRRTIEISREIKSEREIHQKKRLELLAAFKESQCPCVLAGECEGDEDLCLEIEDSISQNDRRLIGIYELVDSMKAAVLACGGEWISTNLDFPLEPYSKLDFEAQRLSLNVFDSQNGRPLSYEVNDLVLSEGDYPRLEFTMPRLSEKGGTWDVDVGIQESETALLFQGEIYWRKGRLEQQGIIYWENPKSL